jgi:hypothetical protein
MPFRSSLAVLLILPLLLGACRPEEGTQEPPESVQETPEEAAVSTEAVAGSYRLVAVNDESLPGGVGTMDECAVALADGVLDLDADADYTLGLLAFADCGDDDPAPLTERSVVEGPYTVEGFEVRFGAAVTDADPAAFEDRLSEELVGGSAAEQLTGEEVDEGEMEGEDETVEEGAMPALFDISEFAATGVLRDSLLTVRLDEGLTTLSFVKE